MIAVAASLALASSGCAVAGQAKVQFVREVYADEIRIFSGPRPAQSDDTSLFSRDTQKLQNAAKSGPGPKLEGPILHRLFGWHVFPNFNVELKAVEPIRSFADNSKVSVILTVNDAPRRIVVSVSEDCWAGTASIQYCIDDLSYENGTSYKAYLKSLTEP